MCLCFRLPLWPGQCLEARDYVEEFLVNSALTQAVEAAVEVGQQFINVAIRAFHRGQTTGVLAGEGFGA